jgi:hypothetical protein
VGINETFLRDSVSSRSVAILRSVGWYVGDLVRGGGVGLYKRSGLGFKVVESLLRVSRLRNRVVLMATIYRPPNTSVVYRSLDDDYGFQALVEIYLDHCMRRFVFLKTLMLIAGFR